MIESLDEKRPMLFARAIVMRGSEEIAEQHEHVF